MLHAIWIGPILMFLCTVSTRDVLVGLFDAVTSHVHGTLH